MANTYSTLGSLFTAIANAIRAKTGSSASIVADDFPTEITNIPSGGGGTLITKNITANGTYNAQDDNADGYSSVTVNVPTGSVPSYAYKNSGDVYVNGSKGKTPGTYCVLSLLTENGNYCFNPASATDSARVVIRFQIATTIPSGTWQSLFADSRGNPADLEVWFAQGQKAHCGFYNSSGTAVSGDMSTACTTGVWYYLTFYYNKTAQKVVFSLYSDDLTLLDSLTFNNVAGLHNNTSYMARVGGRTTSAVQFSYGFIDFMSIVYEIDGVAQWGATNSKTRNLGIPTS